MRLGSLFSGIGGLERGVEAAVPSACVAWQAESDPHARAVLSQHYPDARRYNDVREIDERAEHVDIICGGFPCQDISLAGAGAGIDGPRSGLWAEYARIVRVLRPGLVFIENVAALLGRGLDRVLGDLTACGYDAVWETFRASDVGAPHRRDRLFLLAYADGERVRELYRRVGGTRGAAGQAEPAHDGANLADAHGEAGRREARGAIGGDGGEALRAGEAEPGRRGGAVADAAGPRRDDAEDAGAGSGDALQGTETGRRRPTGDIEPEREGREYVAGANGSGRERQRVCGVLDGERTPPRDHAHGCNCPRCYAHRFPPGPDQIQGWDSPQPAVRRSDDGVSGRSHRLRLLGNAVVPQQATLAFLTLLDAARAEIARAA